LNPVRLKAKEDDRMAWTSNFPERFGELVGEMTYREVGEKLNISKATVGAYLNGKREPKRPVLLSIAHTYGRTRKRLYV
jgi:hypothetical protein